MPSYRDIITLTEAVLAKRDPYNHHGTRVSVLCKKISQALELNEHEIEMMIYAGALHDIGKLVIREDVVSLPRKFTNSERAMMKSHSIEGYNILAQIKCDNIILDATLHHHENWDGTGYPEGLQKEQISIYARILRIVDTYDALISHRSYRKEVTGEQARVEIEKFSGIHYDTELVKLFFAKVVKNG